MKVGIVTFHWADNYGAVLQAFALQSCLESLGHEARIIDYRPFPAPRGIRAWLSRTPKATVLKWEALLKRKRFETFRRRRMKLTPRRYSRPEELSYLCEQFDAFVAGSDQVWNPRWLEQQPGMDQVYFLQFASRANKKIAYAASIGHADLDTIPPEWRERMGTWLNDFNAIGLRERSGANIVRRLPGREDACAVADPTLLLSEKIYADMTEKKRSRRPYIFAFLLHNLDDSAQSILSRLTRRCRLPILRCNARYTALHSGYSLPTPENWLRYIRHADWVVTNSFHCVVFCLIFKVSFYSISLSGPNASMNARLLDLLEPMGLGHRILSHEDEIGEPIKITESEWLNAHAVIRGERARSQAFLTNELSDREKKSAEAVKS